jgi:hypothetical protein
MSTSHAQLFIQLLLNAMTNNPELMGMNATVALYDADSIMIQATRSREL